MKSSSNVKSSFLFALVLILIEYCSGETKEERQNREKYCGLASVKFPSFLYPWYVGLRVSIGSEKFYYTGTLISNSYVVTSAANFDADHDKPQSDWENLQNWAALPGAFNIPDIKMYSPFGHYYIADWSEIIRKEIHPLYNSNDYRYNVAVVQLKNKLEFGPESRYNPICLPQCDHVCKTRTGQIEHDLVGKAVVVSRGTFEHSLEIIPNKKCQEQISNKVGSSVVQVQAGHQYYIGSNKIKRLVIY